MKNARIFNSSRTIVAAKEQPVLSTSRRRIHDLARRMAALVSKLWAWISAVQESRSSARKLRLEETVSLGQKRFLALVQVNGKHLLIGGGAQEVTLLADLGAAKKKGATSGRVSSRNGRINAPRSSRKIKAPGHAELQSNCIKPYALATPTFEQVAKGEGETIAKRTRKSPARIEAEVGECA